MECFSLRTHSSSEVVFGASPTFEKFDICSKVEPMNKNTLSTIIISALLTGLLSSCASTRVTDGLNALMGYPIETAFNVMGYPDAQMDVGSEKVYIWKTSSSSTYYTTQTSYNSGYVGNNLYSGTSTYSVPNTINSHAEIKIVADRTGRIINWDWYGNEYGLDRYAGRLGKFASEQKMSE